MATITSFKKKAEDCVVGPNNPFKPNRSGREQRMPDGYDPEKVEKLSDYRDKMTFDEVAANDIEMAKDAIKNANRYFFKDAQQALAFVGKCVQTTLNHCGLLILENMPAELVQKKMDKEKIIVENRTKNHFGQPFYAGEDAWRNGLYIYKAGELVAFISSVSMEKPSPIKINQNTNPFVITNAKVAMKGFR